MISNYPKFLHRLATKKDIPNIVELMQVSIEQNMQGILSPQEIIAAKETMGLDTTLIEDKTYFVISPTDNTNLIVACGGWGKRKTLYGGNLTSGRDDSLSDPKVDAARIRAMYTHPNWTRQGIARMLLNIAENAARESGFSTIELGSTVAGHPFYLANGFTNLEKIESIGKNDTVKTVIKMTKSLSQ